MSLSDRNPYGLHKDASLSSARGYDFVPGDRVITVEGFAGEVVEIRDGLQAIYVVALDAGMGGGDYDSRELSPEPVTATVEHTAADDYPVLSDILVERPPPPRSTKVAGRRFDEWMLNRIEEVNKGLPPTMRLRPGNNVSVDWCRFRRDQRCYFPKELDVANTELAGYPVWEVEDRGYCPRERWSEQKECPVAQPGPRSGEVPSYTEVTRPYEEGGQRLRFASLEVEAAWSDIVAKAKRIRSAGGVKVISAPTKENDFISGEVEGDNGVYKTSIVYVPGTRQSAMWECGCEWSKYSWGRSGRWKPLEGRMCAHALALFYEAQARSMFGEDIVEDAPGAYGEAAWPSAAWATASLRTGAQDFLVQMDGDIFHVEDVIDGSLVLDDGSVVPAYGALYPTWHPTLGLTASLSAEGADGADMDGCMIAIRPSEAVCQALLVEGGEDLDNLHITLAYLGKRVNVDLEYLKDVVRTWAAGWAPMEGKIAGYGVFQNPDTDVLYATPDVPGLDHFRADLETYLTDRGFTVASDHGFNPHMTLLYGDPGSVEVPDEHLTSAQQASWAVDAVLVAAGADWEFFPLGNRGIMPIKGMLNEEPEAALPSTDGVQVEEVDGVPARTTLSREAAKTFSQAERTALIEEGEDVVAANLERLDISGTHYEALEASLAEREDDTSWMF